MMHQISRCQVPGRIPALGIRALPWALRSISTASSSLELASLSPPVLNSGPQLPFYTDFPLERRADARGNHAELEKLFMQREAILVPLLKDQALTYKFATSNNKLVMLRPAKEAIESILSTLYQSEGRQLELNNLLKSLIFLGIDTGSSSPIFALDLINNGISTESRVEQAAALAAEDLVSSLNHQLGDGGITAEWKGVRGLEMDEREAALAATAVGLTQWNRVARFSSSTGEALGPSSGGYSRKPVVTEGGTKGRGRSRSVWPRIDPAVIMLCTHGPKDDWCLLGRKAEWPEGRFSTLAGFLEVGEALEQAVARECEEESGVAVDLGSVAYVTSQPWPFPRSLMLGFLCKAKGLGSGSTSQVGYDLIGSSEGRKAAISVGLTPDEVEGVMLPLLPSLTPQAEEMEAVGWFHRSFMESVVTRPSPSSPLLAEGSDGDRDRNMKFHLPGKHSLASVLIKKWVDQGMTGSEEGPGGEEWRKASNDIPQVSLDVGTFKYVLMRMSDGFGRTRLMVWGDGRASYHMHVLSVASAMAKKAGMTIEPLGGGRIERVDNKVYIYGYSVAFGVAPHEISRRIIQMWHPLAEISHSYEGY
jgi:NADH pyrophosphatase NudC (nudix superfamily)